MTEEGKIKAEVRKALGRVKGLKIFNNPVGQGWIGDAIPFKLSGMGHAMLIQHAQKLSFGLIKGSGDLIGWKSVTVTPDMVGKKVAIFTSIEVKTDKGRMSAPQLVWKTNVIEAGGIATVVRSPDEAVKLLGGKVEK
jgi:hypothetical protein